jgi:hypothetical protein
MRVPCSMFHVPRRRGAVGSVRSGLNRHPNSQNPRTQVLAHLDGKGKVANRNSRSICQPSCAQFECLTAGPCGLHKRSALSHVSCMTASAFSPPRSARTPASLEETKKSWHVRARCDQRLVCVARWSCITVTGEPVVDSHANCLATEVRQEDVEAHTLQIFRLHQSEWHPRHLLPWDLLRGMAKFCWWVRR